MITEIYSNSIYMLLTILLFALAFDLLIGEFPAKLHPVVWIGSIISFFKKYLIGYDNKISGLILSIGVIAVSSLIVLVPMLMME